VTTPLYSEALVQVNNEDIRLVIYCYFPSSLAGAFFAVIFTIQIGASYYAPPYFSTEMTVEPTDGDPVSLPDIVLCDPSPWDTARTSKLNITQEWLGFE